MQNSDMVLVQNSSVSSHEREFFKPEVYELDRIMTTYYSKVSMSSLFWYIAKQDRIVYLLWMSFFWQYYWELLKILPFSNIYSYSKQQIYSYGNYLILFLVILMTIKGQNSEFWVNWEVAANIVSLHCQGERDSSAPDVSPASLVLWLSRSLSLISQMSQSDWEDKHGP